MKDFERLAILLSIRCDILEQLNSNLKQIMDVMKEENDKCDNAKRKTEGSKAGKKSSK